MASKRIDININSTNTGNGFKSAASDIAKLNAEASKTGSTVGSALNKGISQAQAGFDKLKSSADAAFGSIKAGASAAAGSLGGLQSALAGVVGGYTAMQAVNSAWQGATQRQFNEMYLRTKMSSQAASDYIKEINRIVAVVPGNDTWMNALLSGALARQTTLSKKNLEDLAWVSAKYVTAAQQTGASILPVNAEREISQYIKTGNTTLMARDGLLRNQIDKLEGIKTVEGRIAALQKVMTEEGYMQLDIQDLASAKWEVIKGKIGLAAANVGTKLLPYVEKVLDFLSQLDEKTNGWSTTIAFVGVALVGLGVAIAPLVTATIAAAGAMAKYRADAQAAALANAANKGPGTGVPIGTSGGIAQKISDWIGTAGGVGAGAGLAVAGKSLAMRLLTAMATGISTIGLSILGPAFMGLFEEGSLLSGSWNPGPQMARDGQIIGQQFGNALNAGIKGSLADQLNLPGWLMGNVVPAFQSAFLYIQGAWNNTVAWLRSGAWQIMGALSGAAATVGGAFSGAWNRIVGGYNWMRSIVSRWIGTGISVATGAIDAARNAWNSLRGFIMNNPIVGAVRSAIGFGPAGMGAARGPGIGLSYENYGGHKKNAWNASGTGLSGNCVDMTLGLMSAYGGSMVSGTWNGGAHVWWQSPSGAQLDPARKALEGTWAPPARGPGDGNFGNIVIHGDVYGFDDFKRKVEQANASIGYDAGMF